MRDDGGFARIGPGSVAPDRPGVFFPVFRRGDEWMPDDGLPGTTPDAGPSRLTSEEVSFLAAIPETSGWSKLTPDAGPPGMIPEAGSRRLTPDCPSVPKFGRGW